ncbi:hypothetical protein MMU07_04615 [Aquiflexum sp. LQ15W]|uniref:hypothetical protein n=1 Tax=Cognataquiflexum nitidum TaxID=2922272 RepID=UPI001F13598D|nr:hypothetical protein [Cognataquiflexum nitidum]MCH6198847.1 hypothetical protein [Cognataquiflexum nitidum]
MMKQANFQTQNYIVILTLLFTISCKNSFFYTDLYTMADRKSRFFLDSYAKETGFALSQISVCQDVELANRLRTPGLIKFFPDSIKSGLTSAFKNNMTIKKEITSTRYYMDSDCRFEDEVLAKGLISSIQSACQDCEAVIIPQLKITSKSLKNTYWGGPTGFSEDLGDDKHLLEYKLVTSIYRNDTLIYMDNRTHWTEVIGARGEKLQYQVPQEVIDTLVKLSLEEYFKRMK